MAGLSTCRSPHSNPLPIGQDELAWDSPRDIPINNNGTLSPTLTISQVFITILVSLPTPTMSVARYRDKNL